MATLSDEQLRDLAMFKTLANPAEAQAVVDQILAEHRASETSLEELRKQEAVNRALLDEAESKRQEAAAVMASANAKHGAAADLESRCREMLEVLQRDRAELDKAIAGSAHMLDREAAMQQREQAVAEIGAAFADVAKMMAKFASGEAQ